MMISQDNKKLPNFTLGCSPSVTKSFASHNENLDRNKEKVLTCIRWLEGKPSFLFGTMFKQFTFSRSFYNIAQMSFRDQNGFFNQTHEEYQCMKQAAFFEYICSSTSNKIFKLGQYKGNNFRKSFEQFEGLGLSFRYFSILQPAPINL